MLLSNRLTYCITTFILLAAFVAVPVMAHGPEDADTVGPHTHPVTEAVTADTSADPPVLQVPIHGAHPTVTIVAKPDQSNVRDNIVAVITDPDTNDDVNENEFTLLVTFDVDVADLPSRTDFTDITINDLGTSDFTVSVVNKDNTLTSNPTLGITRIVDDTNVITADGRKMFEVTVTITEFPSGTADTNDETLTFRIRVNSGGVFGLQTSEIGPDGIRPVPVPGGGNERSDILTFTLVNALPDIVTTLEMINTLAKVNDEIPFEFVYNQPPTGTAVLSLRDITITNGTIVDFGVDPDDPKKYILTVRAIDPEQDVTVEAHGQTGSSAAPPPDTGEPTVPVGEINLRVTPPIAPDADGKLVFTITSNLPLDVDVDNANPLSIGDFDIDTEEAHPLASGDLSEPDVAEDGSVTYMLTVHPKTPNSNVTVELRAGASTYTSSTTEGAVTTTEIVDTPGAEGRYSPEEGKPTIAIAPRNLDLPSPTTEPGQIDSIDGGEITITASDNVSLANDEKVVAGEVTIENGSMMAGSFEEGATATFTVIPNIGATSVKVTVAANAVADGAGNTNAAKSETFSVGPIFEIPANTIMVIHKSAGMTHGYLSDQPRLPINEQPPTPVADIATDIWHNMPDLEVLFSRSGGGNGGTLNVIEAHGQEDIDQKKYGDKKQKDSVRISEVMWAVDLSLRGAQDDAEAAEQWIEVSNDTGTDIEIFLYARTGLDSAINIDDGALDRVGNAYNGKVGEPSWDVPGQNGNSYTGVDFVSMHRKYTGGDNRGYENGTSAGNWSASGREYLTLPTDNPNDGALYNHKGSPGRRDSINLERPSTKAGRTAIPGSSVGDNEKVVINEVANRSDAEYEWIELRNNGSAVADLRNFRISMVTAVGTETELFRFAHNDAARIPVGGVLLLVATDPRYDDDHPIAVGYNVDKGAPDQVAGLGLNVTDSPRAPARYKVVNNFGSNGLPDDGKFVIIVRSPDNHENKDEGGKGWAELATDDLKTDNDDLDKITDIAGWTDQSLNKKNYPETNPVDINETHLWPLVNFGAPNVDGRNKLEVNRVHYRQHVNTNDGHRGTGITHKDKKVEQIAWRDAGYSGIGYKRTARNLIEHRGTPGYHNNTVNNKANSSVMISEVMYSTGANGQLPQWIELYNSSATKAVHLGSGWRIMIETLDSSGNALTNLLTISFKDKGRVKYIYPQQTVLVAAGNARQAGSDFQAASVVFPENRIFNVYRDIGAGELKSGEEFKNDRYMFFNPKAFYLGLLDKDGAVVDALGNLDGDSRTNDTVTADEEFPSAVSDGVRSSIIRIYDDGVARAGMGGVVPMRSEDGVRIDKNADGEANMDDIGMGIDTKYSWIPAVNTGTEFKITIRSTWYGDEDDYGTPGHRRGLVLPVQLSFFRPTLEDGVVTIRWTTESELDNAGFNIYRSETRDGEYKQVNTELIDGAGTTGERSNYSWVDQTAKPGVIYYYQIEDVSFAGDREALAVTKLKGLISAKNKLTTTWSELKEASQ